MGQSVKKLANGSETKRTKLDEKAETCYKKHVSDLLAKDCTLDDFYQAICEVVEEMNSDYGYTQFTVPTKEVLERAFNEQHKDKEKLTEEEFKRIIQATIMKTGFTGIGVKDILLCIFGVPATALLVKQGVMPKAIPNPIFIPAVTSATAFVLSTLNKL